MIMKTYLKPVLLVYAVLGLLFVLPAGAEPITMGIQPPEHFNFGDNFYTVYGGPNVTATLVGNNEYSRGDEVSLAVNLMNRGVITGFRSERNADDTVEARLQRTEMGYEAQRTTAIGISTILVSDSPYIRVKSGPQEAGSLASGDQTSEPIQFNIEVSKNAPAGEYSLDLDLYYGYQKNVQVSGDDVTDSGITNMEVGLWYAAGHQAENIKVIVREEPRFEVVNVTSELVPGRNGMIYVTYMNNGEEKAKDATVRISAKDPFSTTDDQSYIGSLAPGETAEAVFRLSVDDSAIPKPYAINSEIRYEDMRGHNQVSDIIRIETEVVPSSGIASIYISLAFVLVVAGISLLAAKKLLQGNNED